MILKSPASLLPNSLHIIDTTGSGGAETLFVDIAQQMLDQSGEVIALIRGSGWLENTLRLKKIPYLVRDNKGSFNFAYLLFICKLIKSKKIEIVHCHLLGSSIYGSLAGALTHTPVVSTFHGLVDIKPDERFVAVKTNIINRHSSIVAVSNAIRANLIHNRKISATNVLLIANGIDCHLFDTTHNQRLRALLQLPENAIVVGSLGNVRPAKDYSTGISSIANLVKKQLNAHLVIAGDPKNNLVTPLKNLARDLSVEENIHFIGFVDDPNDFLSGIDIFLSSSTTEGQPLSIFQAMSKALPIVATRSGVESVLSDGETAWLAPIQDPAELASTLLQAINNPAERQRRGRNAREFVIKNHSKDAMLNAYMSLYRELCSKK